MATSLGSVSFFKKFETEMASPVAMVMKAKEEINISTFDSLLGITGLTKNELASLIDTTPKTIDNYRATKKNLGVRKANSFYKFLFFIKKERRYSVQWTPLTNGCEILLMV